MKQAPLKGESRNNADATKELMINQKKLLNKLKQKEQNIKNNII